jgi:Cu/Ag efflux protein CusF
MKTARSVGIAALVGVSAFTLLAGCSEEDRSKPPAEAAAPMQSTQSEPSMLAEEYIEGEATIQSIDRTNRTVTLRNAEGRVSTVKVPSDVNIEKMKAGDDVVIGLYQSLSARVLPPGSSALGATFAAGSTPPGEPGGRAWGQQLTVVNAITAIDLTKHTVTLRGADGKSHMITVKDADMQQRLNTLKIGDLVELTYSEAVAARLMPKR